MGCEGIVEEMELEASYVHLVHLTVFLATLVALHFTLVSKSVSESVSRSFKLA